MIIADDLFSGVVSKRKPRYIDEITRACSHIVGSISSSISKMTDGKKVYLLMSNGAESTLLASIMKEMGLDFSVIGFVNTDIRHGASKDMMYKLCSHLDIDDCTVYELTNNDCFYYARLTKDILSSYNRNATSQIASERVIDITYWTIVSEVLKDIGDDSIVVSGGFLRNMIGYASFSSYDSLKDIDREEVDTRISNNVYAHTGLSRGCTLGDINCVSEIDIAFPMVSKEVFKSVTEIHLETLFSPSTSINSFLESKSRNPGQETLFDIDVTIDDTPSLISDISSYMGVPVELLPHSHVSPSDSIGVKESILLHVYNNLSAKTRMDAEDIIVDMYLNKKFWAWNDV